MNIPPRINLCGVLTVLCSEIRHCAKSTLLPARQQRNLTVKHYFFLTVDNFGILKVAFSTPSTNFAAKPKVTIMKLNKSVFDNERHISPANQYLRVFPACNHIVCGDSLTIMKSMPNSCIELAITSPPYNLKNSTGNGMSENTKTGKWAGNPLQKGYSHYNDNMPHKEYADWQHECLIEMFRLLKDDGAIFYNHKWRVQDGLLQDRQDIVYGLPVRQIIIWKRKGGINFNPGYFLPTYEVIYLIAKPKFKLVPKANAYGDVWEFKQEMKNEHPAPFPVDLIERIVTSTNAKLIFDPFMGSGTTAIAALKANREYFGIDISPEYCEMAKKRINTFKSKTKPNGI